MKIMFQKVCRPYVSGMFTLLLSIGFKFVNNFKKNTGNVFYMNLCTFYMTLSLYLRNRFTINHAQLLCLINCFSGKKTVCSNYNDQ
jgi:hypothetical protein